MWRIELLREMDLMLYHICTQIDRRLAGPEKSDKTLDHDLLEWDPNARVPRWPHSDADAQEGSANAWCLDKTYEAINNALEGYSEIIRRLIALRGPDVKTADGSLSGLLDILKSVDGDMNYLGNIIEQYDPFEEDPDAWMPYKSYSDQTDVRKIHPNPRHAAYLRDIRHRLRKAHEKTLELLSIEMKRSGKTLGRDRPWEGPNARAPHRRYEDPMDEQADPISTRIAKIPYLRIHAMCQIFLCVIVTIILREKLSAEALDRNWHSTLMQNFVETYCILVDITKAATKREKLDAKTPDRDEPESDGDAGPGDQDDQPGEAP